WNRSPYTKDAFHRQIIQGEDCCNPAPMGTKACLHYGPLTVPAGGSVVIRLRLTDQLLTDPLAGVDALITQRKKDAGGFYETIHPPKASADERRVQRQALAGMLWTKQIYLYDHHLWVEGDNPHWPPPDSRRFIRNVHWRHLNSMRVLSMPDKW